MTSKTLRLFLSLALIILLSLAAFTGCGGKTAGVSPSPSQSSGQAADVGAGETVFPFEVTDSEGNITKWNVHTNETTVGAALLEVELIAGEKSEFGLMVKEVNGVTADYDKDKAYWAFYVDGEYATAGVDTTDREQGRAYSFVYTAD
jgi:hypothetical protein